MKKILFILFMSITSYSRGGEFGASLNFAFNCFTVGIGGSLHFAHNFNEISSIRLLGGITGMHLLQDLPNPTFSMLSYNVSQLRLQYLYHLPADEQGTILYFGAGIGYLTYRTHTRNRQGYTNSEQFGNTIGVDAIFGVKISHLVSVEVNYQFAYPELSARVFDHSYENEFYLTETVNMSTLYLNLIFSIGLY